MQQYCTQHGRADSVEQADALRSRSMAVGRPCQPVFVATHCAPHSSLSSISLLTTSIFLKPLHTSVLRSSQPMPPAPTHSTRALAIYSRAPTHVQFFSCEAGSQWQPCISVLYTLVSPKTGGLVQTKHGFKPSGLTPAHSPSIKNKSTHLGLQIRRPKHGRPRRLCSRLLRLCRHGYSAVVRLLCAGGQRLWSRRN